MVCSSLAVQCAKGLRACYADRGALRAAAHCLKLPVLARSMRLSLLAGVAAVAVAADARQLRVGANEYLVDAVVSAELSLAEPAVSSPIPATVLLTSAIGANASKLEDVLDTYAQDDVWAEAFVSSA